MFGSLVSCASLFVLLISTLFSPTLISANRCGERLPVTLLGLYRTSQFIYIGTFDRVEEGEIEESAADYDVVPVKKYFTLSTALKGETKKMLVLEESQYRYKPRTVVEEAEEETQAEVGEDGDAEATAPEESETAEAESEEAQDDVFYELEPGDHVMLFLNKDDDSGELELADYIDGLKKMTPARLAAYEPRIRELNDIFSKAEPSYTEIVAWLVRCAEDPLTRWEGTYELSQSFRYMEWNAERAKSAREKPQAEEGEIDLERFLPRPPKKFDTGDENFAKELSETQKLLLTNMMLTRERPKPNRGSTSEDTAGMNRGDRELFELVRRWGDSKVAANILDQIRYDDSDANLNSDLMESVASILNDEDLTELSAQYSQIKWRDEGDDMDEEDEEQKPEAIGNESPVMETENVTVDTVEVQAADEVTDEVESSDIATSSTTQPKNEPKKKTYGEVRTELMKRFLDRADRLIIEHDKSDKNE